jgi:hypothetical protein
MVHKNYLSDREWYSAQLGRNRQWTQKKMAFAARLWRYDKQTKAQQTYITRIMYDQHWHGGNRSKDITLTHQERTHTALCELCGLLDSQSHIVNGCRHPTMQTVRRAGTTQIRSWLNKICSGENMVGRCGVVSIAEVFGDWMQEAVLIPVAFWVGVWTKQDCSKFAEAIERHPKWDDTTTGQAISKALVNIYQPITATTLLLYKIRSQLLRDRSSITIPVRHPIIKGWFQGLVLTNPGIHHPSIYTPQTQESSESQWSIGTIGTQPTPPYQDNPLNLDSSQDTEESSHNDTTRTVGRGKGLQPSRRPK